MNNLSSKKNVWLIILVGVFFVLTGLQVKAKDAKDSKNEENLNGNLLITYDYLDLENPLTGGGKNGDCYIVKFRENVTFKVTNVNPFLYRVRINSTLKDYFLESPKIYQETAKEAMEMKKKETDKGKEDILKQLERVAKEAQKTAEDEALEDNKKLEKKQQEIKEKQEELYGANKLKVDYENAVNEAKSAIETENKKVQDAEEKKHSKEIECEKAKNDLELAKAASLDTTSLDKAILETNTALSTADEELIGAKKAAEEVKKKADEIIISYQKKVEDQDKEIKSWIQELSRLEPECAKFEKDIQNKAQKLKSIQKFLDAYRKMDTILDFYNQIIEVVFKNDKFDNIQAALINVIEKTVPENKDQKKMCSVFRQWMREASDSYSNIDFFWLQDPQNKDFVYLTPDYINELKKFGKNIDTIKELGIIGKIQTILTNLTKDNFSRSVTIPNVESDEIQFRAEIEPLPNAADVDVLQQIIGPVVVRVEQGWVINFSTGVLFQINAHDRTYRLEEAPTQNTANPRYYIRENENKYSITPAVAALMHIYPRSVGSVKWGGITFGIGTEDTKRLHYYIGSSFMFGFLRRFVLNFGVVITEIDYLKPGYQKDVEVKLPDKVTADDLVGKQFKTRLFFGFTYNLNN